MVTGQYGGCVPNLDARTALGNYRRLHGAIRSGMVSACHDLSEGGLAVAIAEMAFSGNMGARLDVTTAGTVWRGQSRNGGSQAERERASLDLSAAFVRLLFAESNARHVVEIAKDRESEFAGLMQAGSPVPISRLGEVTEAPVLIITSRSGQAGASGDSVLVHEDVAVLRECWKRTLRW
jgi:phosphoribosylformylglycinamidine synthase